MKYEYVVLEMPPTITVDKMTSQLNSYGALGFKLLSTVMQQDHVIYTLVLERPQ